MNHMQLHFIPALRGLIIGRWGECRSTHGAKAYELIRPRLTVKKIELGFDGFRVQGVCYIAHMIYKRYEILLQGIGYVTPGRDT